MEIQYEGFKNISNLSLENVANKKTNVSEALQETLSHIFESFNYGFFTKGLMLQNTSENSSNLEFC